MSKTKLLTILVVALLILNIGVITALVFGKPGPPPHKRGPKKVIIERLNLDDQQIIQYEEFLQEHKASTRQKGIAIKTAKDELFQLLRGDDYSQKDSLINEISKIQIELEQLHFKHFQDIKEICRPEQLNDFKDFTKDLGKFFRPPHRKKR